MKRGKELLQSKGLKTLACECGREVRVDADAVSVKCFMCVIKKIPAPELIVKAEKKHETGFPPGNWRWKKQFVHADGRVFEKGVENVALKGTLPATPILSKFERRKRREEKELRKMARLAKQYKKKKEHA